MIFPGDVLDKITQEDKDLQRLIGELLWKPYDAFSRLPEQAKKPVFQCHSICRGLSLKIGDRIAVKSGYFLGGKKVGDEWVVGGGRAFMACHQKCLYH